jgi:hypothetical protein
MPRAKSTVGVEPEAFSLLVIAAAEETIKRGKRISTRALATEAIHFYVSSLKGDKAQ